MSPKILRRCTICKRFHASYLVEDRNYGKCYLCYSCWESRQMKAILSKDESVLIEKRVTPARGLPG